MKPLNKTARTELYPQALRTGSYYYHPSPLSYIANHENLNAELLKEHSIPHVAKSSKTTQSIQPTQKAATRYISEASNENEIFYESSPVLPEINSPLDSGKSKEYLGFELEEKNIESNEDTYSDWDRLNTEKVYPIVQVDITPVGLPLLPNDASLNLNLVHREQDYIYHVAPYCGFLEDETWALLNILEYEISLLDEDKLKNKAKHKFGIGTLLRQFVRGYNEYEYNIKYPWAKYVLPLQKQEEDININDNEYI